VPANFLDIIPPIWDERIDEYDDDVNWKDPRALSRGRSRSGDRNDNDDSESEEDAWGAETGTGTGMGRKDVKGTGKATEDRKGKGKGKRKTNEEGKRNRKGNRNGKSFVTETPGGDDISRAITLQLQMALYEAYTDTEGYLEWVHLEPEASPTM